MISLFRGPAPLAESFIPSSKMWTCCIFLFTSPFGARLSGKEKKLRNQNEEVIKPYYDVSLWRNYIELSSMYSPWYGSLPRDSLLCREFQRILRNERVQQRFQVHQVKISKIKMGRWRDPQSSTNYSN